MKKQESKLRKAGLKKFGLLIILGLLICGTEVEMVMAESGNAYTATAHPYYKHPVTGEIEDPGNNEGIGQGMTESVLNPTALLEKTADGKLYATVRFYLAEYISEVEFWTQERGGSDWNSVSFTIMQENLGGEYCTDYRLEIPAEDAIVRSSFYVSPMGRKVIFYMDFSDLKEGNGDFVVGVDTGDGSASGGNISASAGNGSAKSLSTESNQNTKSTKTQEGETADAAETLAAAGSEGVSARELIASADGLVLSDSNLLKSAGTGTTETVGTAATTEESDTAETEGGIKAAGAAETKGKTEAAEGDKEAAVIPAVSWKLVWQCILIITIPGLLVGGTLMGVLIFLRREERK